MDWIYSVIDVLEYRLLETDFSDFGGYSWVYVPFNILEGLIWWGLAVYVMVRYLRYRKTTYELLYSLSFVVFGMTDFVEAAALPVWLLIIKGMCLVAILLGRKLVIGYYEGVKL